MRHFNRSGAGLKKVVEGITPSPHAHLHLCLPQTFSCRYLCRSTFSSFPLGSPVVYELTFASIRKSGLDTRHLTLHSSFIFTPTIEKDRVAVRHTSQRDVKHACYWKGAYHAQASLARYILPYPFLDILPPKAGQKAVPARSSMVYRFFVYAHQIQGIRDMHVDIFLLVEGREKTDKVDIIRA